jgi:hypothetical protein
VQTVKASLVVSSVDYSYSSVPLRSQVNRWLLVALDLAMSNVDFEMAQKCESTTIGESEDNDTTGTTFDRRRLRMTVESSDPKHDIVVAPKVLLIF